MHLEVAKWVLGPLLLAQGQWVRRRATPVLAEPPGPREGIAGTGAALSLVVVGDSAAAGVGAGTQEEALVGRILADVGPSRRVAWRLIARTGATTASTLRHLQRIEPFAADVVVTSLGVNDVTGGVGPARFSVLQTSLFQLLRSRFCARLILASGVPPMDVFPALPQPLRWYLGARARELDAALRRCLPHPAGAEYLALPGGLGAAHMAADGFHPGSAVYEAWGRAAAQRILRHG